MGIGLLLLRVIWSFRYRNPAHPAYAIEASMCGYWVLESMCLAFRVGGLPVVSIVVPFFG